MTYIVSLLTHPCQIVLTDKQLFTEQTQTAHCNASPSQFRVTCTISSQYDAVD